MRFVGGKVNTSRVRGRCEQQSRSSLPGIARRKTRVNALVTPQVGFTRLAAHYAAQLGQARVAVQSILIAKKVLTKKMDHPKSGLPDFGRFKCASRVNPTCVVNGVPADNVGGVPRPAGDGRVASARLRR